MEKNARMELAVVNQIGADPIPAFAGGLPADLREQMTRPSTPGCSAPPPPIPAGPMRATSISSSPMPASRPVPGSSSPPVRPEHVAAWREPWPPTARPTAPSAAS